MMWSRTCFTSSYRRPWGDMCEAVVVGTGLMLALPSLKGLILMPGRLA